MNGEDEELICEGKPRTAMKVRSKGNENQTNRIGIYKSCNTTRGLVFNVLTDNKQQRKRCRIISSKSNPIYSLDHVENALVLVEPDVVVGNGDVLEGNFLGVLEERVWSPHRVEPGGRQQAVIGRQVIWET